MKINCYIALVAAALACACNPLADTDDMDNNVQATRIAFSPEVVTLDNAGRNAEESGVAFRKGSDAAAAVDAAFDELKADGTMQALAEKYELALAD